MCKTPAGAIVSVDTPALCKNATYIYWRVNNFTCDLIWSGDGLEAGVGAQCSGDYQHCTWPWYRQHSASTYYNPSCVDKSDQVFPINTTCREHNLQFLQTYKTLWCSGNSDRYTGIYCDILKRSCSITGPDCVACEHEDFFHCPSTGFCINKDLVCDGHPHPSCGGDDEGADHCYDIYYKKGTVVRYATLICPSLMYPGNNEVFSVAIAT